MTWRGRHPGHPTDAQLDRALAEYARVGGIITPDQFGAVGDGVTDDTAAVKAALLRAGPGRTVTLHPGRKYLTNGLALDNGAHVLTGHACRYVGQGPGSTPVRSAVTVLGAQGSGSGIVTANVSAWAAMFDLGALASGRLVAHATNGTNRTTQVFTIGWTGAVLTATSIGENNAGNQGGIGVQAAAGQLEIRSGFSGSNGATMALYAEFDGEIVL